LYREKIAVCSDIHTKHINMVCRKNIIFSVLKPVVPLVTSAITIGT